MENIEYTTKEAVENYILKTIDDGFDAQLTEWIKAMSNYIESITKRRIYRATPETYKYDGDGSALMVISDVNTITEVKVDDTVMVLGTDYFTYPQNKGYTSRIVLNGWRFTKGFQNVSVTGKQAMSATLPSDIKFACTVLVAGIINNQLFNDKKGTTERIGGYSVTYKDDKGVEDLTEAKNILSRYTRITF